MFAGRIGLLVLLAAQLSCLRISSAAQLRVEPVLLELNAPSAAGTLTLRNSESSEVTIQTRVLRWSQSAGKETLEPTADVVASPPAVTLSPGAEYIVRIVRTSRAPLHGEEAYRVIIDQLPQAGRQTNRAVNLLIRQSIPVFFRAGQLSPPRVSWAIASEAGKPVIAVQNSGDERLRIASLRLRDASGSAISFGDGLVGYVLGRSAMSWPVPNYPRGFRLGGTLSITAETNKGPTHVVVQAPN